jgi:biopolymer transport protein ExbB/TolQ
VREQCDIEADKLDSELSMVRYISWAIPSIGFIGTVRGIGDALGQAYKAVEGDISGVTVSLGVAFNSTFVALGPIHHHHVCTAPVTALAGATRTQHPALCG